MAPVDLIPLQGLDDDARVAAYGRLRERDLVGRGERFIAEGEVVLRVLLSQRRHEVESVLVSERRLATVTDLLAAAPGAVPVYVAPQSVMDGIVGFPIHRGVLAVGRRAPAQSPRDLLGALPRRSIVIVLIGLSNHDNVGGIFRNAAAFGAGAVLLDPTSCDPLYRKAIRVSVGGSLLVPFTRGPVSELLEALVAERFELVALSPGARTPLASVPAPERVALLLGAEGPGLPDFVLAQARPVRIPIAASFDSLNVATASGIALDHFARLHAAELGSASGERG